MNRTLGSFVAFMAACMIAVFAAPSASADTVDDYAPWDVNLLIDVGGGTYFGGDLVPVSVEVENDDIICNWTLTLNIAGGGTASSTSPSKTFSANLASPVVPSRTPTSVTATCGVVELDAAPAAASSGTASATQATYSVTLPLAYPSSASATAEVILLPRGGDSTDSNGFLPGTGGFPLWLLVAGGALVVGGGAVTVAARRRSS
ncbi:LPXTG-motif cell wall anchor domain protein [Aeromicrobium marinum DSM 15272]|uniref:LPXTG-motif cell wall anchor domain protein n=1 Tax=Aeromicrobium marinum DSM 15272 TaxID=585531 RepID=E2SBQ9_9ACTN|nr:hypothetical protein [Aeromicrobium marinum]EFQ83195.1 LPXTG-motif cell wall anchor domain protein [Aeromicrobium marinum DSM 15272]